MKRYIKYSFSLAVALVILGTSKNSYALFPTFDVTSFKERFEGTMQTIKSYGKVKEATETASDTNNSIGGASKSMGELGVDDVKKAKEKKDKFEKMKKKYEKTKEKVEARKKQLEEKKKEFEKAKEKAEAFKKDVDKIKSNYDKTVADVNKFKSDVEETKGKIDEYKDKADSVLGKNDNEEESSTTSSSVSVSSTVSDSSSKEISTSVGRQPFYTVDDSSDSIAGSEEINDSEYELSAEELQKITDEAQASMASEEEKTVEEAKDEELAQEEAGKMALEEEKTRIQLLKEMQNEGGSLSIGEKAIAEEKKRIEEIKMLKEESKSIPSQNINGSRRKPFGKTSYRNSESLVFAKIGTAVVEEAEKRAKEVAAMSAGAAKEEKSRRSTSPGSSIKPSGTATEQEQNRKASSPGTKIKPSTTAVEEEKNRAEELSKARPGKTSPSQNESSKKSSSYYKNSERLAFADVTSVATDAGTEGPTGLTDDGIFILSEEAAIYCNINVNTDLGSDSEKMKDCLVTLLSDMSSDEAAAAAEGQKRYTKIVREQVIGTLAETMRLNNEAAQFNTYVLDPLAEDIGGATNTRDDVATLSLTNKETVYVINRLTFSSSLQLALDALKQVNYFDAKDMEEPKEEAASSSSTSEESPSSDNEAPATGN